MSYPTTKTVYTLSKYSRAFSVQQHGTQNTQSNGSFNWQHHIQPLLQLVLTTARLPSGHFQAIRVTIIWSPSNSTNNCPQRDLIFEDLDLLYFQEIAKQRISQNLPLKAVYRGQMVGFKYLLPPNATSSMECRRFQVNFQIAEAATQLIDAIRSVCPCKPSGLNEPSRSLMNQSLYLSEQARTQLPDRNELAEYSSQSSQMMQTPIRQRQIAIPSTPIRLQGAHILNADIWSPLTPASIVTHIPSDSTSFDTSSNKISSKNPSDVQTQQNFHDFNNAISLEQLSPQNAGQGITSVTPSAQVKNCALLTDRQITKHSLASLQVLTPLSSSSDAVPDSIETSDSLPGGLKTKQTIQLSNDSLLSFLKEASGLLHLSQNDFETLVALIIQEEDFVQMLERVDNLWKLKGFAKI